MNKNRQSKHIKTEKRLEKVVGKREREKKNKTNIKEKKKSQPNSTFVNNEIAEKTKAKKPSKLSLFLERFGTDIHSVETPVYSRILNELSRVAKFKNVVHKEGKLTFEAPRKERDEIIALLDNLCYTHNIERTKGTLNTMISVLKRAGLIVGLFCAIGAFLVYPHFVFNVEYNGDSDKKVQDALTSYSVEQGAFLWHFDEEAIEKHLLSLEGISFASVEKVGTRVCVHVVHELPVRPSVSTMGNTIATKGGVVTRIVVYSGTAEVVVGDTVEKGQTLIGDYYLKGEDKVPTTASGEVYVERQVVFERFFPDETFVETGVSTTKTVVGLFRQSKVPKAPYQYYTTKLTTTKNDFFIPFVVYNWTFYEIKQCANTLGEEEMKAIAYGEIIEKYQFEKVIDRDVTIERANDGYNVKIIMTVEEKQ